MKKIITLISVLLICITSFGQFPQNPTQGQTQIKQTNLGAIEAQRGLKGGSFVDTSAANAVLYMKGVAGILIYTTSDDNYWYRSADAARWLLFGNSVTNCLGTQLISGSITWSGSGLIFDATDLDYSIICTRYSSSATTITLSTADPTYARIDKLYADITGNVGVITGTPAPNPQEPVINPLSQLDMGIVYIPAGSTVPAGTTQTVIYNEDIEWVGTSDVPSVNFTYATNPYIGSVSTYLPNAPNSSYVEWQSNGTDYLFSDAQYLKFWVRLNDNFVSDPISFLDVTFEYTDVTVSQTLAVGNGDYNMDYDLINQWQLVSIPLIGITTFGTEFNSVHFVINSAPSSFQLDYVYLLGTATVPPAPVGGTWLLNGNSAINDVTQYIGTRDAKKLNFGTNGQIRAYIDTAGIELLDDTTANVMLIDSNGKIWKTYQPTILADSPLVIYLVGNQRHIKADTTDANPEALATQYDLTQASDGWNKLGNAGTVYGTNFIGTTDNVSLGFRVNNVNAGQLNVTTQSTGFGVEALNSNTGARNNAFGWNAGFSNTTGTDNNSHGHASLYKTTTGINNNAYGYSSLYENITGSKNNAFGYRALAQSVSGTMNTAMGDSSLITLTTGSRNTAIGANADVATSSTDSSIAIGYQAVAATKQVAFSPHVTTMFLDLDSASGTAPAIAGIDADGNWRKYATPSGSGSQPNFQIVYGTGAGVTSSADLTFDGSELVVNGSIGLAVSAGSITVPAGSVTALDYYGDWAGSVINPQYGGTGVNNGSSTITLGGNLTTSGAYASTFTMTAATGVTFPTTGTLATLAGSETFTNKTITSPTLSGTLIGSGTIGGSTVINTAGSITGFNIVATGLIRSAAGSRIEHNGRNGFTAISDGFETLTSSAGTANTANLSVASLRTGYVAKTANYTATAFDETISCSTNSFTITLPTAVGCAGQKYNITNSTAAQTITIGTTSSQTFANVTATPTTLSLVGLGAVIVVSDGANWLQLK